MFVNAKNRIDQATFSKLEFFLFVTTEVFNYFCRHNILGSISCNRHKRAQDVADLMVVTNILLKSYFLHKDYIEACVMSENFYLNIYKIF